FREILYELIAIAKLHPGQGRDVRRVVEGMNDLGCPHVRVIRRQLLHREQPARLLDGFLLSLRPVERTNGVAVFDPTDRLQDVGCRASSSMGSMTTSGR